MREEAPIWRRITALGIMGLLPILSGTIPVLDTWAEDTRDGIEHEHHPGTHGYAHDHTICIQQDSNQWAPSLDLPSSLQRTAVRGGSLRPPADAPETTRGTLSPRPRAPPVI